MTLRIMLPFLSQPSEICNGTSRQHLSQRPLHNLSGASSLTWLLTRLCLGG